MAVKFILLTTPITLFVTKTAKLAVDYSITASLSNTYYFKR